jgi:hypothetical protein
MIATRCAHDHEPIEHSEFYCPLCVALDDTRAQTDRNYELEEQTIERAKLSEQLAEADTLQLLAQVETLEAEAHQLRRVISQAHYTADNALRRHGTKAALLGALQTIWKGRTI